MTMTYMVNEERFILDKGMVRDGYIRMLANLNTKYHLTITFPANTPTYHCRKNLDALLKHLNRRIYKKRYDEGKSYLKGAVIREHTFAMNTDHYHILISDDPFVPDRERFIELLEKQLRFLGNDHNLYTKRNFITGYKLQDYYNNGSNGLEGYLTKCFEGREYYEREVSGDIGLLHAGAVVFGDSK